MAENEHFDNNYMAENEHFDTNRNDTVIIYRTCFHV